MAPAAQTGRSDWERELFALTPGGSEFVGDAKRCAEFVRERLDAPFRKKAAALTSQSPVPAPQWWAEHREEFINGFAGAGFDTHEHYDIPAALEAFAAQAKEAR
jgi:hypothetical protein